MRGILAFVLLIIVVGSCKPPRTDDEIFNDLKKLEGNWSSYDNLIFNENWKVLNDSTLTGIGYSLNGEDTLLSESLKIQLRNQEIIYSATVMHQNQGDAIPFILQASSHKTFVFENPEHDYPNRIIYKLIRDSLLRVRIETMKGTKPTTFNLRRN